MESCNTKVNIMVNYDIIDILQFIILVKGDRARSVEFFAFVNAHVPVFGDILDLLDILDDDFELVISVTEFEESLEYDSLECALLIENAVNVQY